ncbi:MAG: 3-deoxy-D-manno-octulosonic acid transferase [Prevotella sp.]|nr:3-deoxy-D-manno-octulosonic acid transferase [Prevotella sp.]
MYNIIIYIYLFGVAIASLFNKKVKKMWQGEREAFDVLRSKVDPNAQYVWFHAASLGEFEQGRPIMERLRKEHPEYKILLTFFSPSGYEVRKNYDGADIICYLPLDTPLNARRFLRTIRPVMAFFIKYEFWYNYLHILKHRGIPTYSVSSIFRDGQIFFRWYGHQYGRVLKCFTHFFVQNEKSRQLLAGIGITNVSISGDTRFDRVLEIKQQAKKLDIVEAFVESLSSVGVQECRSADNTSSASNLSTCQLVNSSTKKVFVAGSSWQPDEEIFIKYFNEHPDWKLIIAPHVIGESHLQQIIKQLDMPVARYTKTTPEEARNARCLIIDCFGLLSCIYNYGTVSYVGGGFGVGIHNVLEAAVWNIPVIFGPNNERFAEAQGLKRVGGGFEISDYDSFASVMNGFIADEASLNAAGSAASDYVKSQAGATDVVLKGVSL